MMDTLVDLKAKAAQAALSYVQDDMRLGLGSGSTARIFIELLARRLTSGDLKGIQCTPTSEVTAAHARALKVPLASLSQLGGIDLAIDGADEVDPALNLIKGLGRALLREKLIEIHADRLIIIVDESKVVTKLGSKGPLPVEIVPFEVETTVSWLKALGCDVSMDKILGELAVTDNGNYVAHCLFRDGIDQPHQLARKLADRPGVVEHGLFLDMADIVIIASSQDVKIVERP